ncbi:MAG: hypothetical protein IJ187_10190 [Neisseriaceae bacterium]|nr:hypothetical protein [Neisseriaceae bacterium]MBQ9724073.1 hypothetical protein [Neisseriaceae bacterium]MBR0128780.1 hypothetical protein [Neisseriaceae bacterium]
MQSENKKPKTHHFSGSLNGFLLLSGCLKMKNNQKRTQTQNLILKNTF